MPSIDSEHMALVAQLDRLHADPGAIPGSEPFSEILSRLGRQIFSHFDSEEKILRDCAMPADLVLEHIKAHTEILDQYARLNMDLMHGAQLSRDEALGLVRHWIVKHVLTHDVRITEYLPGADTGTTPSS